MGWFVGARARLGRTFEGLRGSTIAGLAGYFFLRNMMMRKSNVLKPSIAKADTAAVESLESRQFFAASFDVLVALQAAGQKVIGPTSGATPSAVTPSFATMSTVNSADVNDLGNTSADRDTAIRLTITPNSGHGGVDATKLFRDAVQITNLDTGEVQLGSAILDKLKTSGGGDTLILQPTNPLAANTTYKVQINGSYSSAGVRVRTTDGSAFAAFTANFTTGTHLPTPMAGIAFSKTVVAGSEASGATSPAYLATTIGPDHKLYASTSDGKIYRWTIAANGGLTNQQIITTVIDENAANRIITGITFDPGSTPDHLVLWVSHGQYRFGNSPGGSDPVQQNAQNYTGKLSVLSGPNLATYQDMIVGIPRSVKDHINNQIVFDPKGKSFYFAIPSMNAMGAQDATWGNRAENLFSASIMRSKLGGVGGLNAWVSARGPIDLTFNDTNGVPNSYNIYKGSNPLRFFATGVRNAFDFIWHSNGHLYSGINGSSAGGNVPATPSDLSTVPVANRIDKDKKDANGNPLYKDSNGNYLPYAGPTSGALSAVQVVEQDTLLDLKEGSYYGHPNRYRGEYIFDGGNPTSGVDPYEIPGNGTNGYAVGQQPDRNYTLPAYDFGQFVSPDGLLEYNAVGGKNAGLDRFILVARYSSGSDIIALKANADGSIDKSMTQVRVPGLFGLKTPLDMVEDPLTGNVYVTELIDEVDQGAIVLLKPDSTSAPQAVTSPSPRLSFYVAPGGSGVTKTVTLSNTGNADLVLDASATKITGTNRKNFGVTNLPTEDYVIEPGGSLVLNVVGALSAGQTGPASANLALATNDPDGTYAAVVPLRVFNINAGSRAPVSLAGGLKASTFGSTRIGTGVLGTDAGVDADEVGQLLSAVL